MAKPLLRLSDWTKLFWLRYGVAIYSMAQTNEGGFPVVLFVVCPALDTDVDIFGRIDTAYS
jgi:hypothetical protein